MEQVMKWRELRDEVILRDLQGGEDVLLTHEGTPVAKVIPIRHPRRFVPTEEVLQAKRGLPGSDSYARLRADTDAVIDPYDHDRRHRPEPTDDAEL